MVLQTWWDMHTHTHARARMHARTHTQVSQYQKGKINLDLTETRDSEWQWHQLGRMQVCNSLQADNHTSTHHSVFHRPMPFLHQITEDMLGNGHMKANKQAKR